MKEYPKGLYYNAPRENAPDFVLGSISIKKQDFIEWLTQRQDTESGYINLDILNGKEDKPYVAVNTYKKQENTDNTQIKQDEIATMPEDEDKEEMPPF